jgi:prepilin-type N-terminal cleavage/methylation domain-containing protein
VRPGFTLLEVLVAAALFALVMALAGQGVALTLNAWRASAGRQEQDAQLEAAQQALRRLLEAGTELRGTATSLRVAGRVPMAAGLESVVALDLDKGALVAVRTPLDPSGRQALAPARPVVLVERLAGGAFGYFGSLQPGRPPQWHESWPERAPMPLLVRVRLAFPSGDARRWPELLVMPMVEAAAFL